MSDVTKERRQIMPLDSAGLSRNIMLGLDRHIVLIGMMGAGKSKLGKLLSKSLQMNLVDVDKEIEKSIGLSVAEIFDRLGEKAFRDAEAKTIHKALHDRHNNIIATGGGAVMNADTTSEILTKSVSVWVRASLEVMVERTSRNTGRPLLKGVNIEEKLKDLMKQRYPVYEKASVIVDSHDGPASETLHQALVKLDEFLKKR